MMRNWVQERRSRQADIKLSRQLDITNSTTDLVALLDIDGFLTNLNRAGYTMLGLEADTDITRLRMEKLFTGESAGSFVREDIPRAVASGASHCELALHTMAGDTIPVSMVLIAHKDTDGNLSHFSVILRDITAIKQSQAERERLLQQLHQSRKMETLGTLAGGVAHDFNNLITVIMGYAELALLKNSADAASREELELILQSAGKASRLSSKLLEFSSRRSVEPQVVDLNDVLLDSLNLIKSVLGDGISVSLDTVDGLWPVKIDRSQLDQIILNLTVNARDAMNLRGAYTLVTENRTLDEKTAQASGLGNAGDYVVLRVGDTGCGIEPEILEQIFYPFFTTKSRGKGTGLGLSTVYGAVKQNNGHITVTSTPGEGSIFEICFPRDSHDQENGENASPDRETPAPESGSESILLVEDNESIRNLLTRVLARQGYRVMTAGNGKDALDLLEENRDCDLVISDVVMPGMNGMDLCRKLQERQPPVKLMLMSGYTNELISAQELIEYRITLLQKPFQSDKFVKVVRDVLDCPDPGTTPPPSR